MSSGYIGIVPLPSQQIQSRGDKFIITQLNEEGDYYESFLVVMAKAAVWSKDGEVIGVKYKISYSMSFIHLISNFMKVIPQAHIRSSKSPFIFTPL